VIRGPARWFLPSFRGNCPNPLLFFFFSARHPRTHFPIGFDDKNLNKTFRRRWVVFSKTVNLGQTTAHWAILRTLGRLGVAGLCKWHRTREHRSFYSRYCRGKFVLDIRYPRPEGEVALAVSAGRQQKKIGGPPRLLIPTDDGGSGTFVGGSCRSVAARSFHFQGPVAPEW